MTQNKFVSIKLKDVEKMQEIILDQKTFYHQLKKDNPLPWVITKKIVEIESTLQKLYDRLEIIVRKAQEK